MEAEVQTTEDDDEDDEEETMPACVEYHVYVACPGFGLMV